MLEHPGKQASRAAVCRTPDGRITIFEIAPDQARAATAVGLKPLNTLPDVGKIPRETVGNTGIRRQYDFHER